MTKGSTSRAVVQEGPRRLRRLQFPLPQIGPEDALLRVEACGICGSDYEQYAGVLPAPFPVIPGHEPVGVIDRIGDVAARRWGVKRGDRVAVETLLPCGHCRECVAGRYRLCRGRGAMSAYGYISTSTPPSLWGGYAQYMYLDPHSLVHRMSPDVPAELAVLFNPLGAGFRWAVEMPGTKVGDTVVVLGPGQRGLASVIACREAGAGCIIVTGLAADERKLALARRFGAHHTIDVQAEDPVGRVREITDGRMADVVVDVTAYALEAVTQAVDMARRGGTIVLGGTKGFKAVPDFVSDKIVVKELTVKGAFGVDYPAYEAAIRLIESGRYPLEEMHTHTLPLEKAEHALRLLAREIPDEEAIHIALVP
ncbi:MAG: zinc-binding dehydrogenase [Gemmatimonadetes bacterium]|nr:zinc-binding dehydrogenase [Gemmatimonadota bacterium]